MEFALPPWQLSKVCELAYHPIPGETKGGAWSSLTEREVATTAALLTSQNLFFVLFAAKATKRTKVQRA